MIEIRPGSLTWSTALWEPRQDAEISKQQQQLAAQGASLTTLTNTVAELTRRMGQMLTPTQRPEPRTDPATGCGGAPLGAGCQPSVEGSGDGTLQLKAAGGLVLFETDVCGPTDLCRLAQDARALIDKLEAIE